MWTPARAAMASTLAWSQPRSASSSRAASSTAARGRSEESMAGPLLVLLYSSAKLQAGLEQWLTGLKAAAERR